MYYLWCTANYENENGTKHIDHSGSSFDDFMREEGVLEEAKAVAIKRVIAWQIAAGDAEKAVDSIVMLSRACRLCL